MPPAMQPAPTILLTRPEAAARRFADHLPGWTVLVAPLMRIVPVAHDAARLSAAPGLVCQRTGARLDAQLGGLWRVYTPGGGLTAAVPAPAAVADVVTAFAWHLGGRFTTGHADGHVRAWRTERA